MNVESLVSLVQSTGVPCVRDCWMSAPEGDAYAVVCLMGEIESFWADNRLQAQVLDCNVYLYSRDGQDEHAKKLQSVFAELEDEDLFYELKSRSYLQDVNMICWQWSVRITDWYGDAD